MISFFVGVYLKIFIEHCHSKRNLCFPKQIVIFIQFDGNNRMEIEMKKIGNCGRDIMGKGMRRGVTERRSGEDRHRSL